MKDQRQVNNMQIMTFLVSKYDYQIVSFNGIKSEDFWLINMNRPYPLICITKALMNTQVATDGPYRMFMSAIMSNFNKKAHLLILNTNPDSTEFELEDMKLTKVLPNQPLAGFLRVDFEGIQEVVNEVKNERIETKRLTRELKKKARSTFFKQMKSEGRTPVNSLVVGGICIAIYLLSLLLTLKTKDSVVSSILLGSYYKMSVIAAHEYWRLITAGFVHIDIFHLLVNMMSLMNLALAVEHRLTKKQYWFILLASIFTGNLFELITSGNIVGLGLSGGLFGLLGAYIIILYVNGAFKNQKVVQSFSHILVINLMISLVPGVSFLAHLGGFVTGGLVMIYFNEEKRLRTMKKHALAGWGLLIGLCLSMVSKVQWITPVYGLTDTRIIQTVYDFNLDFYGDYLMECFTEKMDQQNEPTYRIYLEGNIQK